MHVGLWRDKQEMVVKNKSVVGWGLGGGVRATYKTCFSFKYETAIVN